MDKMRPNLCSSIIIISLISTISVSVNVSSVVGGNNDNDDDDPDSLIYCPLYCICDFFQESNRANCSGQQLISANVEVPNAVELLELTHNEITVLDNECFQSFHYLINITIAHNAIHTIYLDAFSPLHLVKYIDLSYNRLEYFDDRIFETNSQLLRLDLSGNKLSTLQNKPLIRSSSLQYLNLQNSQITHIYKDLFVELHNLIELDISKNLMITIDAAPFIYLLRLKTINLDGNRWICDKSLDSTVGILRRRKVQVILTACAFEMKKTFDSPKVKQNSPKIQFERMVMLTENNTRIEQSDEQQLRTNIQRVWKNQKPNKNQYTDEKCENESWEEICYKLQICFSNINALLNNLNPEKGRHHNLYTANDLNFVFLTGVSLGVAIVICIMSCGLCMKHCFEARKKLTNLDSISTNNPDMNVIECQRSFRTRRATLSYNRSLTRTSGQRDTTIEPAGERRDLATFIASLFERPTRHQYYRTFNQNTATLIRRLSRSNLFNNRQNQNFSENISPTAPDEETLEASRECENEYFLTTNGRFRPETPPPSYRDIVINRPLI